MYLCQETLLTPRAGLLVLLAGLEFREKAESFRRKTCSQQGSDHTLRVRLRMLTRDAGGRTSCAVSTMASSTGVPAATAAARCSAASLSNALASAAASAWRACQVNDAVVTCERGTASLGRVGDVHGGLQRACPGKLGSWPPPSLACGRAALVPRCVLLLAPLSRFRLARANGGERHHAIVALRSPVTHHLPTPRRTLPHAHALRQTLAGHRGT